MAPCAADEKDQSCCAHVVDFRGRIRQPFRAGSRPYLTSHAFAKIAVVLGVAVRDRVPLAAFDEPFKRIDAGGFEQPQARLGFGRCHDGERFFDQFCGGVDDVALEKARIGDDCAGCIESEAAHKDPQAAQHGTLGFREHVVAPVEGRSQRPMPRRTRPAAAGQ